MKFRHSFSCPKKRPTTQKQSYWIGIAIGVVGITVAAMPIAFAVSPRATKNELYCTDSLVRTRVAIVKTFSKKRIRAQLRRSALKKKCAQIKLPISN